MHQLSTLTPLHPPTISPFTHSPLHPLIHLFIPHSSSPSLSSSHLPAHYTRHATTPLSSFPLHRDEKIKCYCGSSKCTGFIGSNKNTPFKLRKSSKSRKKKMTELFSDVYVRASLPSLHFFSNFNAYLYFYLIFKKNLFIYLCFYLLFILFYSNLLNYYFLIFSFNFSLYFMFSFLFLIIFSLIYYFILHLFHYCYSIISNLLLLFESFYFV